MIVNWINDLPYTAVFSEYLGVVDGVHKWSFKSSNIYDE